MSIRIHPVCRTCRGALTQLEPLGAWHHVTPVNPAEPQWCSLSFGLATASPIITIEGGRTTDPLERTTP